jgi:hypothetical protein
MKRLVRSTAGAVVLSLALASGVGAQSPSTSPATSPSSGPAIEQPHPAHIHTGTCAELGDIVVPLSDVTYAPGQPADAPAASRVEVSSTEVELSLDEILESPHAIMAHESATAMQSYIACADLDGALFAPDLLVVELSEQNGSGFTGIAFLRGGGDTTLVDLVLIPPDAGEDA